MERPTSRVAVSGRTIIARKKAGMTDHEALFSPKKTHNGNVSAKTIYRAKLRELKKGSE